MLAGSRMGETQHPVAGPYSIQRPRRQTPPCLAPTSLFVRVLALVCTFPLFAYYTPTHADMRSIQWRRRRTLIFNSHRPPTEVLAPDEKDLIWRFRFYLCRDKRALTKFLRCVDWTDASEAKQAAELMEMWDPIDVDDALELLGPTFTASAVRGYAVSRLEFAADEDLGLYLLQLVQAVKAEPAPTVAAAAAGGDGSAPEAGAGAAVPDGGALDEDAA